MTQSRVFMFVQKLKNTFTIAVISALLFSCSAEIIDPIDSDVNNPTQAKGIGVYAPTALGVISNSPQTYGIRNDRKLSEYELIASNIAPYNTADFPNFSSVVSIHVTDGDEVGLGSGVLINSEWILTAAHNFILPEETTKLPNLNNVTILFGNDPNKPNKTVNVSQIIVHPHWITSDGGFEKGTDLALVKLATPITDITPAIVNFDVNGEKDKAFTWLCGFGDYSQESGQNTDDFSKKHALVNVLDRIVNGLTTTINGINYNGGILALDFDAPDGKYNTLGDNTVNEQEKALGAGNSAAEALEMEGGTVKGDSGGPIFLKIDNVWKVCGLLHGGVDDVAPGLKDSSYGDISVYCRTASAASWILSVTK